MELAETHVGQTVFDHGNRENWWVVTGLGKDAVLAKFHNGGSERARFPHEFEPIPYDLHDNDGKPLRMGDKVRRDISFHYSGLITGAEIHDRKVWIRHTNDGKPDTTTLTIERLLAKVEPVETVDDVRAWAGKIYCNVTTSDLMEAIDRTDKAVRAEYKK